MYCKSPRSISSIEHELETANVKKGRMSSSLMTKRSPSVHPMTNLLCQDTTITCRVCQSRIEVKMRFSCIKSHQMENSALCSLDLVQLKNASFGVEFGNI